MKLYNSIGLLLGLAMSIFILMNFCLLKLNGGELFIYEYNRLLLTIELILAGLVCVYLVLLVFKDILKK